MDRIIVVGGGLAGLRAATALREQGYVGRLTMLAGEGEPPYDRPPLSKQVLLRPEPYDPALPFDAEKLDVEVRLGAVATGLRDGVLATSEGQWGYDGLVIATGATPIRLPGDGARYLRTHGDALRLRDGLRPGATVVIVGAGWIGAEVATAAAAHGCRVLVLERAEAPVSHALPTDLGARMLPWYEQAGVEVRTNQRVERTAADGVRLDGGEWLPADLVLVAVGVRPASDWLEGSGVERSHEGNHAGGVRVDAGLRTSLRGVAAVGDVVARWSPRYGTRLRNEHWDDAVRGPAVAAANLLRDRADAAGDAVYDPVPYVWSEQFGRMVQFAGRPTAGARRVERGTRQQPSVFWLDEQDRIVALLVVDRPKDFVHGRKLAASGSPVDPGRLADPATQVRAAVAGSGA